LNKKSFNPLKIVYDTLYQNKNCLKGRIIKKLALMLQNLEDGCSNKQSNKG